MPPTTPQPEPIPVQPSPRKLAALRQLYRLPLKLSDGYEYQLHEALLPGVTLAQVRKDLKVISEPLAETVVEEREHA